MRCVQQATPVVRTALTTLERHLNFLLPELVIFALFDINVPAEERKDMAVKLFSYKDHWQPGERLIYSLSVPGPDFCLGDCFWRGNFKCFSLVKHLLDT